MHSIYFLAQVNKKLTTNKLKKEKLPNLFVTLIELHIKSSFGSDKLKRCNTVPACRDLPLQFSFLAH